MFFLAYFFFTLLGIWKAKEIFFDNSQWFGENHSQKKNLDYLNLEYENGETTIFVVNLGRDFFEEDILSATKKIGDKLEKLDYVNEVKTPLHATTILSSEEDLSILPFHLALSKKVIPSLSAYKEKLRTSFYYKKLISEDFQKIAFVVKIEKTKTPEDFYRRQTVIKKVTTLLQQVSYFQNISIVGEGQLNYQLDLRSRENLKFLLPLALLLMTILLFFIFPNFFQLFIVIFTAFFCLLLSANVMVLQNHPMTVIGLALPVLILVIATADSIHIVSRWNRLVQNNIPPKQAVFLAIKQTWLPCLGTSITTAIGFGSFYFSNLLPLKNFGLDSFITIVFSYFVIIFMNWFLLFVFHSFFPTNRHSFFSWITNFVNKIFLFSQKWRKVITYSAFILMGLLIYQLKNIIVETNFLDVFFQKKSVLYQDFLFADKELSGTGSIDILFSFQDDFNFKQVKTLEQVKKLNQQLTSLKEVNSMQSYLDPIKMLHQELTTESEFPETETELEQELLFLEFSRGDKKTDVISPHMLFDYSESRIHLQTPNLSSNRISKLKAEILTLLKKVENISFILTGNSIFFHSLSEEVLNTQLISILITILVTWIIFMLLFGWALGTIALIPSIFPVLLTSGVIIFLKIPFDFAVILIGSISFGLCVDDTIHLVHHYKNHLGSPLERLQNSTIILSHPLLFTTVLFCIGCGVFLTSDLVILMKFGLFTCLTILGAFFSTIILLPSLIAFFFHQKFKK